MDRLIYLSMSGAKASMQRQEVLTNNLANASTTGFRAELAAFRAVPIRGDGATTRAYALETTTGYDDKSGPVTPTGNPLPSPPPLSSPHPADSTNKDTRDTRTDRGRIAGMTACFAPPRRPCPREMPRAPAAAAPRASPRVPVRGKVPPCRS